MQKLQGRVAVVTGAGSGIGRAAAQSLARRGVSVVCADQNLLTAEETSNVISLEGGKGLAIACDVSDADTFPQLREAALSAFGRIEHNEYSAGQIGSGFPEQIPIEIWEKVFAVNFLSYIRSNQVFVPYLIEQGEGHIVNTASFAGLFTYSFDRVPYAATKAAIVQLSEALAIYLRPLGVGVTLLCPGPVATNIGQSIINLENAPPLRSPGQAFDLLSPEKVGEQVVGAIQEDRFMLATDDKVFEALMSRVDDWDAFIASQIETSDIRK